MSAEAEWYAWNRERLEAAVVAVRDLIAARAEATRAKKSEPAVNPAPVPDPTPAAAPATPAATIPVQPAQLLPTSAAPATLAVSSPVAAPPTAPAAGAAATPVGIEQLLLTTAKRRIGAILAALGGTSLSIGGLRTAFREWQAGLHAQGIQLRFIVAAIVAIAAVAGTIYAVRRVRRGAVAARTVAAATGAASPDGVPRWHPPKWWPLVLGLAGSIAASVGGTNLFQNWGDSLNGLLAAGGVTAAGLAGAGYSLFRVYRQTAAADVLPATPVAVSTPPTQVAAAPVSLPVAAPPAASPIIAPKPSAAPVFQREDPAAPLREVGPNGWITAFRALARPLGLDAFEENVLLLALAAEIDPGIAPLCADIHGNRASAFPTPWLALELFPGANGGAFSPAEPLRAWRLLELLQPEGRPLMAATLRPDEQIVFFLHGRSERDELLLPSTLPLAEDARADDLSASQWLPARDIQTALADTAAASLPPLVELRGADSVSKQLTAAAALGLLATPGRDTADLAQVRTLMAQGRRALVRIDARLLPAEPRALEQTARLWRREALLHGLALYLDADELDTPEQTASLRRFLQQLAAVAGPMPRVFVATREPLTETGEPRLPVVVERPTAGEQEETWRDLLQRDSEGARWASRLASHFRFNLPTIVRLANAARPADAALSGESVWGVCRAHHRSRLDTLAQRIEPKATWDDLVLPEFEENLLHALADQVDCRGRVYGEWGWEEKMSRGLGITALFAGESGTGKTTAAEVIACELKLDLYRVDLSAIVDKYIGVTEKNLCRLFDAADEGGLVLCFEEADALFGKRTEVKDSHDRYANIQIDYLLQRLEAFRGLAMLTSNKRQSLDAAFTRRLRFIITFPMPERAQRREIWEKSFPEKAHPFLHGVDFESLAAHPLSGGQIAAIALTAAFLAARENPPLITTELIESAMDAEFMKIGRPVATGRFPTSPENRPLKEPIVEQAA